MKLKEAALILSHAGIKDALREARLIFSHFDKTPISRLVVGDAESENPIVAEAISRRREREPLQYIIGEVGFYNETYKVTPACLIPRSDTELLVEYAVEHIKPRARFLDICTGSGCVAISTLKNTKDTTCVAIDLSKDALRVAEENARAQNVEGRVAFLHADAKSPDTVEGLGKFDAILSNPPYVTDAEYEGLEPEIFHEPKMAFVAGDDGGDFYRALTSLYKSALTEDGFIAYEIGYASAPILEEVAEREKMSLKILRDLSDNPRVAILTPVRKD